MKFTEYLNETPKVIDKLEPLVRDAEKIMKNTVLDAIKKSLENNKDVENVNILHSTETFKYTKFEYTYKDFRVVSELSHSGYSLVSTLAHKTTPAARSLSIVFKHLDKIIKHIENHI